MLLQEEMNEARFTGCDILFEYRDEHTDGLHHREYQRLEGQRYRRSTKAYDGFLNSLLPKIPQHHTAIHPSKELLSKMPSVLGTVLFALVTSIVVIFTLPRIAPWTGELTIILGAEFLSPVVGKIPAVILALLVFISLGIMNGLLSHTNAPWPIHKTSIFNHTAALAAYRFQYGAETRAWPIQVWVACIGGISIALTGMPVAVMVAAAVAHFTGMRLYIKTYDLTKSPDDALLMAIKFYATFMRIAFFVVLPTAITLLLIAPNIM